MTESTVPALIYVPPAVDSRNQWYAKLPCVAIYNIQRHIPLAGDTSLSVENRTILSVQRIDRISPALIMHLRLPIQDFGHVTECRSLRHCHAEGLRLISCSSSKLLIMIESASGFESSQSLNVQSVYYNGIKRLQHNPEGQVSSCCRPWWSSLCNHHGIMAARVVQPLLHVSMRVNLYQSIGSRTPRTGKLFLAHWT